jgi:hypothetical protein
MVPPVALPAKKKVAVPLDVMFKSPLEESSTTKKSSPPKVTTVRPY